MEDDLFSLELLISRILRYGVLASGALLLLGWGTEFRFRGNPYAAFHSYQSVPLKEALETAMAHSRFGLLTSYAGLAILVILPFTRVLLTAFLFLVQKDRMLAAISFFVATALIFSFCLGGGS
jgi:uncharacterized membrane protein